METFKDYYKILGAEPTFTPEQLKSAFRRMVKIYAPDVNTQRDTIKIFEDILEAWNILGNPATRRAYDQSMGYWQQRNNFAAPPSSSSPFQSPSQSYPYQSSSSPFSTPPQSGPYQTPGAPRPGTGGASFAGSGPYGRSSQTMNRTPHRDAGRQRMEEKRRRMQRGGIDGHFETKNFMKAVLLSLGILGGVTMFLVPHVNGSRPLVKAYISVAIFAFAFWLLFWQMTMKMRPPSRDADSWQKTSAIASACIVGVVYGLWSPWFLSLSGISLVGSLLIWGLPFILTTSLLAIFSASGI